MGHCSFCPLLRSVGDPLDGRGYIANLLTFRPLLIFSPALKRWAPWHSASSNPPTRDDTRPYLLICGKQFEVPEAYPKGAEGRLVNDQQFIDDLNKYLV